MRNMLGNQYMAQVISIYQYIIRRSQWLQYIFRGIKLYSLDSISWQQFGYVALKNSMFDNNNMILGRNGIYVTWVAASFGNKDVLTLLLIVWHTALLLVNKKPGWTILLIWQWFKYRFFFYIRRREVIEDKTFNLLQCVLLTRWGRDKIAAIFQTTFSNEFSWMEMYEFRKISLKFVPKVPINTIQALVQIMAWRLSGDKPLSEPMMVKLPTHICVTLPQWVKEITDGRWVNIPCSAKYKTINFPRSIFVNWYYHPRRREANPWVTLLLRHPFLQCLDLTISASDISQCLCHFRPVWLLWLALGVPEGIS